MANVLKWLETDNFTAEIVEAPVGDAQERFVTFDFGDEMLTLCDCHVDELAKLLCDVRDYLAEYRCDKMCA